MLVPEDEPQRALSQAPTRETEAYRADVKSVPFISVQQVTSLVATALRTAGACAAMAQANARTLVGLLCCALTGAAFGFESDSCFEPGAPSNIGYTLLAVDSDTVAGRATYLARVETLADAMLADECVRLPGARREASLRSANVDGIDVPESLFAQTGQLAA